MALKCVDSQIYRFERFCFDLKNISENVISYQYVADLSIRHFFFMFIPINNTFHIYFSSDCVCVCQSVSTLSHIPSVSLSSIRADSHWAKSNYRAGCWSST